MTDLLIDLASYQAGIDLSRPAFDAWNRVNIKTSQGNWYVANRQRSRAWADQARALGKGIMTFHWLDMSTSGAEQARIAFREMQALGGPDGMAHQADTEDDGRTYGPMTYRVWRDYVNAMQDLMGRHVINYTGDWWWPGGWDGASVTPYLMAAANVGYFGSYPGDASPHWNAGYGGWSTLAAMQFRVGPIPNGGPGASDVSMTAIRDPAVWAALTGGQATMSTPLDLDPSGAYLIWRAKAIADLDDTFAGGPEQGKEVELTTTLKRIDANAKAAAAKVTPVAMTDADRQAIIAGVVAQMPKPPTAAEVAEELARRIGNG
jgi:hypothetical protein